MDIYCTKCGEPWELDTFHDTAAEQGISWESAVAEFRRVGCVAIGDGARCETPLRESAAAMRADAAGLLFELLGDDTDGIASMLEDFGGSW